MSSSELTGSQDAIVLGVTFGVYFFFALVIAFIAYKYPIKNQENQPLVCLSITTAICFFPIYLLLVLFQNTQRSSRVSDNV